MAHVSFISASKLVQLLNTANAKNDMHVRILTNNQLALGIDPINPTSVIDLSKEIVRSLSHVEDVAVSEPIQKSTMHEESSRRASRKSGKYLLEVKGRTFEHWSLSGLLAEGLRAVEQHKRGTLEKLSGIKPRTKRIVSRDRNALFEQRGFAEGHSEKLMDGWFFGTNNSADETKTWLKRASDLAGLQWGKDFSVSL
jgi:hypothetical protein